MADAETKRQSQDQRRNHGPAGGDAVEHRKVYLLRPVELLLLVVVDGIGQLPMALGEVHIEHGLGHAAGGRDDEVEGPGNPLMHADVRKAGLLAEGRG